MSNTSSKSWQRVTELFEEALEQPLENREDFLQSACAGDADLLRELQSLLAEHEAEEAFLEAPAIAAVADQIIRPNGAVGIGQQLGQYRVEGLLGAGGMGKVYVARDKLGRRIALKLLTQRFPGDKSGIARFQQEARTLLALNHPHIVTIHDIDETEGVYYIASELVEGDTLRCQLDRGDLNLESVLDISIQVTTALAAAHEKGIVHRDIKPENIMVRRDGFVKVLDFGIAKLSDAHATGESEAPTLKQIQTAEGTVIGTAPYMSPEQARGLRIDARTDIWSLGVVLYEVVAGRKPFTGETTADVVNAILEKTPAPLTRYTAEVPEALQLIVSRALRKDQDARYQTATELFSDLKELRTSIEIARASGAVIQEPGRPPTHPSNEPAPAAATEVSSIEYLTSEIRRHRFGFLIASLLLLSATAIVGFYLKTRKPSPAAPAQIRSVAVLPFKNESGNADLEYLPDGMTETLINSLSRLPNVLVKSRSVVWRFKDKEIDPKEVGSQLSVQAIVTGRVVQRGDGLTLYLSLVDADSGNQIWGQQYDRKMTALATLQTEVAQDVSQKLRPLTDNEKHELNKGGTSNSEAYRAYLKGLYYWQRLPQYEKSREYFQQAIDLDPTYARGYVGLAHYYGFASALGIKPPNENWPRSEEALNKATALGADPADTETVRTGIKLYYYRDWAAAEQSFRRGLELDPNSVELHNHYARCLFLFGRNDEAVTEMKRAVELEPLSLRYNLNFGVLFFFIREYDNAIDQLRKTLELEPNYGPAHEWLGNAYEQKGMQKEAVAEWVMALKTRGQNQLASTLEHNYPTSGFDSVVRALGQQLLDEANDDAKRGQYVAPADYVRAYTRLGNKEQALSWFEKAVDVRDRLALEFKVNPIFDKLRNEQRFQAALERIVVTQ